MLYIPYDDNKRTVDARVRLGIYKQVVEDLKTPETPVFTVYMIGFN